MKWGHWGVPAVCSWVWLVVAQKKKNMVGCTVKCQVSLVQAFCLRKKGNLVNASALTNLENDETFTFVKILADQDETALLLFFKNNFTDRWRCLWVLGWFYGFLWQKSTILGMNNVYCICICQCMLRCTMEMNKLADLFKMQASFWSHIFFL